jgi:predicted transcriptional regulator
MKVRLRPETESQLQELAAQSGRSPDEIVEEEWPDIYGN